MLWLWLWLWLLGPLGEGAHEDGAKDEGGCLGSAVRSAAVQLSRDHSAYVSTTPPSSGIAKRATSRGHTAEASRRGN